MSLFNKITPHLVAIVVFLALTIAYVNPILQGKKLFQSDMVQFKGMSKEIVDFREKTGEEALWANNMFGGMPAFQISVKSNNPLKYVDKILTLGLPNPANKIFLYFIGFYILLISLRFDPKLAALGAIAFGLSSYFFILIEAGHNTKAHALGYMAPVVAGVLLTYRGQFLLGGVITALFAALQLHSNHYQMTYYLLIMMLVFALVEFCSSLKGKQVLSFVKSSSIILVALILALSANAQKLWSTYEYGKETMRGKSELVDKLNNKTSGLDKDYMLAYSYSKLETFNLIIPDFMGGGPIQDNGETKTYEELRKLGVSKDQASQISSYLMYWGDQPIVSGAIYVGAIMFFLFILGLFFVRSHYKWWILVTVIISVLLAWGKNFMGLSNFFIDYVPGYDKFRDVKNILVLVQFAIPFLALIALKEFIYSDVNKAQKKRALFNSVIFSAGLTGLFILFSGFFSFQGPNDIQQLANIGLPQNLIDKFLPLLVEDRIQLLRSDAFRSCVFILLTAGTLLYFLNYNIKKTHLFLVLSLLIVVDMWMIDKRYLNNDDFENSKKVEKPFTPSLADRQILSEKLDDGFEFGKDNHYRVYNLSARLDADAQTAYYHKTLGGYHGAKLKRYQELIDAHLSNGYVANPEVFDMLNAKFFIVPDDSKNKIAQLNPNALGNVWFVKSHKIVNNANEEIQSLTRLAPYFFDASEFAIIDKRYEINTNQYSYDSTAIINLSEYYPNKLVYNYNAKSPQLTVFSEIFYDKGWNAYVNGNLSPYFRVNYVLRGMVLPKGNNVLEFRFEPDCYYVGRKISYTSATIILFLFLGISFISIRKKLGNF